MSNMYVNSEEEGFHLLHEVTKYFRFPQESDSMETNENKNYEWLNNKVTVYYSEEDPRSCFVKGMY